MAFIDKDNLTIVTRQTKKVKNLEAKVVAHIRVYVPAGEARPVAPLGPVLGQHGINMMDFCKKFNEATSKLDLGLPMSVVILKKSDNSFDFNVKPPTFSFFLWLLLGEGAKDQLTVVEAYDLVRIEAFRMKRPLFKVAKIVFGRFLSGKVRIY